MMAALDGHFSVACCRGRRKYLPKGVLACTACDALPSMPNATIAKPVPDGVWHIYISKKG